MRSLALYLLAACLSTTAEAATIMVTITGTTGEIRVGEGPIFGHSSYALIPPGAPFVLTYVFDEEKGKQQILEANGGLITQSQVESTDLSSPGMSAALQIGETVWEFGSSVRSQVLLKTSATNQGEEFVFITRTGSNRVSAHIVPGKGTYWPRNGDWRANFTSGPLDGSSASFAADNDRVSARGSLVPSTIAVSGVDIDGQWLRSATTPAGERKWQLAHASPRGGYIVEQVTLTIAATRMDGSPITPSVVRYWQVWRVAAGSTIPVETSAGFAETVPADATGEKSICAMARFYEGMILPSSFTVRNSLEASGRLTSLIDPQLSTDTATLPVTTSTQLQF